MVLLIEKPKTKRRGFEYPPVVQFLGTVRKEKRIDPKPERGRGCSSAGRAPALQAGGHGFESHHLHQKVS